MIVKELIEKLLTCDPESKLSIIQEEELECMPEWWDDEERRPAGGVIELFEVDSYSHGFYLLAIKKEDE